MKVIKVMLLSLAVAHAAFAGGWTKKKNSGYVKTWLRWQAADGFLNGHHGPDHRHRPLGNYNEIFFNIYAEYGLHDRVTALVFWPVVTTYFMSEVNDYSYVGTGDPAFGLRFGLVQKQWVLALQLTGVAPIAEASIQQPFQDIENNESLGFLRVGAGVWDFEPRLQIGIGWSKAHLGSELGYRLRTNGFHEVLSWTAEGGYRFAPRLYSTLRLAQVRPVGSTTAPLDNSPSGIGNGTKYFGFALELDWAQTEHLSIGLVGEGAFYYSRQAGGPVFNLYSAWNW